MEKNGYVYILFNKPNGTLYTGVTSDLVKRVYEHKEKFLKDSFTSKYGIDKLGYFEIFSDIENAIEYEKKLKNFTRKNKLKLIEKENSKWKDLYFDLIK